MRFAGVASACVLVAACGRSGGDAARVELAVYAAASTRDALEELRQDAQAASGAELVFNFGASGTLARQIAAGGKADLFLAAGEDEMDQLEAAGLLQPGTRVGLLSNQLVVVEPSGAPSWFSAPFDARQLASEQLRLLAIGDPAFVPAGKYAQRWLEARGVWSKLEQRLLRTVDARAALAAVESAAVQAGIVYRSDAARSAKVRIVHAVPLDEASRIVYPLAVLRGARADAARACLRHLSSAAARDTFERSGFVFLPATADSGR